MAIDRDELRETHDLLPLESRLDERYAAIRRKVRAAYRCFDGAPIRGSVMILTDRAACRRSSARAVESTATAPRHLQIAGVSA